MPSPWLGKLQHYLRQAGHRLVAKWQQLRASGAEHEAEEIPEYVSGEPLRDVTDVVPPDSVDFATLLQAAAARQYATSALQGQVRERSCPAGSSWFSRQRDYLVYTPADYNGHDALPLVVVLHGCRQTQHDIRAISGFDALADRERFMVVYPFVTGYWSPRNRNCWAWWMRSHVRTGSGEVEDIGRIIQQVQTEFKVDARRIHITGLSSGAAMTVATLVAHGKLFASAASVAGVAYGESPRAVRISPFLSIRYRPLAALIRHIHVELASAGRERPAPLLVIQSEGDETVELQAGVNLRDSWLAVQNLQPEVMQNIRGKTRDISWHYRRYGQPAASYSVDYLTVEKLPHAWIGGLPGSYSDPRGPNISEIIWLYFKQRGID